MSRLTDKNGKILYNGKSWEIHFGTNAAKESIELFKNIEIAIRKLSKLEDLMEKYEIDSVDELEGILEDYDNMAKDVIEMATGRKVEIA